MRNFATVALLLLFSMPICLNAQRNSPQRFQLAVGITDADYVPGRVIFKVREEYRAYCTGQQIALPLFQRWMEAMRAGTVRQTFPHADRPAEPRNALGERLVDLSLIYQVDYTNQVDIEEAVNLLLRTGLVEYAEPSYIYQSLYNPNDPDTTGQYYLALIKARQAWDISKGDSTVKIGIIDTGGSFFHPDWAPKIAKNWADPIDGFDNDNNGYIDDFQGWDFGGDIWDSPGDNNPQWGELPQDQITVSSQGEQQRRSLTMAWMSRRSASTQRSSPSRCPSMRARRSIMASKVSCMARTSGRTS